MKRTWWSAGRRLVLKARFGWTEARSFAREKVRSQRPTVELERVQRRLELLLTALYGRPIPIASVEVTHDDWIMRVQKFVTFDARAREATPAADADSIHLPVALSARDGVEEAVARYRLLAIEQAERVTRGTASRLPVDAIERDLYLLREGAAIDAKIARTIPGLAGALERERSAALTRRPDLDTLTAPQRAVELLLRDALANAVDDSVGVSADASHDPDASLEWARRTAATIRHEDGYRALPPAPLWGTVRDAGDHIERPPAPWVGTKATPNAVGQMLNPNREQDQGSDQPSAGAATKQVSEQFDSNAPRGGSGSLNTAATNQMLAELPPEIPESLPPGIAYDEWDSDGGRYIVGGAVVRLCPPSNSEDVWSAETLRRHAALVRQIRHHFERLRARRSLLGRQRRGGDELDISACVDAIVDRRAGLAADDRLYIDARPARRGMAISLLVDASGSTEARVAHDLRIIDLEKIALLLASEALDALGDLYSVHAFNGKTASDVRLTMLKDFGERNGDAVRQRVAGLEPSEFTRLGAAIRHSTRQLARQSAGHRLLLILSDGRPNDVDRYQGDYGVEDSRQAIIEARASGVFPFCLTVDGNASEYLPRIFGTAGHTILTRPEQFPRALLGVVRMLIGKP